jgi:hypothetical protein
MIIGFQGSATVTRHADIVKGRGTDTNLFLLLASLAVVIGIVGVMVPMKSREKKVR